MTSKKTRDTMKLHEVVGRYEKEINKNYSRDSEDIINGFKNKLNLRLGKFGLNLKDFRINNTYQFGEKAYKWVKKILSVDINKLRSDTRMDNLSFEALKEYEMLNKYVKNLVRAYYKKNAKKKEELLFKIYQVDGGEGHLLYLRETRKKNDGQNKSRYFNGLERKTENYILTNMELVLLEPFYTDLYPNIKMEKRIEVHNDIVGDLEVLIRDFRSTLKTLNDEGNNNKNE